MKTPTSECGSDTATASLAFVESANLSPQCASPAERAVLPQPFSKQNSGFEGLVLACWWLPPAMEQSKLTLFTHTSMRARGLCGWHLQLMWNTANEQAHMSLTQEKAESSPVYVQYAAYKGLGSEIIFCSSLECPLLLLLHH